MTILTLGPFSGYKSPPDRVRDTQMHDWSAGLAAFLSVYARVENEAAKAILVAA